MYYALNFALELVGLPQKQYEEKLFVMQWPCTAVVVMFTPLQRRPQHERVMIC